MPTLLLFQASAIFHFTEKIKKKTRLCFNDEMFGPLVWYVIISNVIISSNIRNILMATPISDSGGGGGHRGNDIYSSRSPSVPSNIPIKDIYNTDGKLGSINGGIYGKTHHQ